MLYKTELTIPPNTDKANRVSSDILLIPGTIVEVGIGFPPGCNGLAHCVINEKLHQLWPSTDGFSFHWDSILRTFTEDLTISEIPFVLTVYGWNFDNLYQHTITVEINLLAGQSAWDDYLKSVIGRPIG